MATTKLIDLYNYELDELLQLNDIKDNYVVLMNKNNNSSDSNIKVRCDVLKQYFQDGGQISTSIQLINEQIGELQSKVNNLMKENAQLKERINLCESLLSNV